jgi:hypothetical protein
MFSYATAKAKLFNEPGNQRHYNQWLGLNNSDCVDNEPPLLTVQRKSPYGVTLF